MFFGFWHRFLRGWLLAKLEKRSNMNKKNLLQIIKETKNAKFHDFNSVEKV
jgi:hypothetical protein